MKTPKGTREHNTDELRKAKKLVPMQKSGKERHMLYSSIDDDEDEEITLHQKRESVFDYLDEDEEA